MFLWLKNQKSILLGLGILFCLLLLRTGTDHKDNGHYTGDYTSEAAAFQSAENFGLFGFYRLHFLPSFTKVTPGETDPKFETYTHYPPLPHLITAAGYTLSGGHEFGARLLSILITLAGICFALMAILRIHEHLKLEVSPRLPLIWFILLSANPIILCFGDTCSLQPMTEALIWGTLWWFVEWVFFKRFSLLCGVCLAFFHVWISFEWLIPMVVVLGYAIWLREGSPAKKPLLWLGAFSAGFVLPLAMRLLQNVWALGGLEAALMDFKDIAAVRAGLEMDGYSFEKHLFKFIRAQLWFAGPAVLICIGGFKSLSMKLDSKNPQTWFFLFLWGICAISWQFIMRQHGMIHAFTGIHFANFLILLACLSLSPLVKKNPGSVVFLTGFQGLYGGFLIATQIVGPLFF